MPSFKATKFDMVTGKPTGLVEHYTAKSASEAVKKVLYTRRLKDKRCHVGFTGRVVHCPGLVAWTVTREKKRGK